MAETNISNIPFHEYPSTLAKYSLYNQLQAKQYEQILESKQHMANYEHQNPMKGAGGLSGAVATHEGSLMQNPNIPAFATIKSRRTPDGKIVNIADPFWQYKVPAAQIFTDWTSSGVSNPKEDMTVRNMKLFGKIHNPTLVLSNINNVRSNLQNYGKEYLTTTNLLNTEAFKNGYAYESGSRSPYRTQRPKDINLINHSNFMNKADGDSYTDNSNLRVDLPINYANNNISTWQYVNPAFIGLGNPNIKVFHERLRFGTFYLDSIKWSCKTCLDKTYNIIPEGFNTPTDVFVDYEYPLPLTNPLFYNKLSTKHRHRNGDTENLYCSPNTNYVSMPINSLYTDLDTSFNNGLGNNSITFGEVFTPEHKDFIHTYLYIINKIQVLRALLHDSTKGGHGGAAGFDGYLYTKIKNLLKKYENMHSDTTGSTLAYWPFSDGLNQALKYNASNESDKYANLYNIQRNLQINSSSKIQAFISNLAIFKFGGNSRNHPHEKGEVLSTDLKNELGINKIEIHEPGCYLLLPTMLSEDLFPLKDAPSTKWANTPAGSIEDRKKFSGGNCPHSVNATEKCVNSCFCGPATLGQGGAGSSNNAVPNNFLDPYNLNNDIDNLKNECCMFNPYDAPDTF